MEKNSNTTENPKPKKPFSMIDFLFNGTWGMLPKCLFWFMLGWIICSVIEWGSNDGVPLTSFLWGIGGTIIGGFSLYITLQAER